MSATTDTPDDADDSTVLKTIATQNTWDAFTSRLTNLVTEAIIVASSDGLRVHAVEAGNIATVRNQVDASAFDSYTHDADGTTKIGVNLEQLEDVLDLADSGDLVQVAFDLETRKLHISTSEFAYKLAAIDPESIRDPQSPDLEYNVRFELAGKQLRNAIKGAEVVGDRPLALGFDLDTPEAYAEAEGDTDEIRFDWDDEDLVGDGTADESVESLFSIGYLDDTTSALDDGAPVSVELGTEYPIRLEQPFLEGDGHVQYMIAPRVQSS